jgi:hypothetical protein
MGRGFEPQAVGAKSIGQWFKNGLELGSRKPVSFITLVGIFAGVHYTPEILSNSIFMFLMPILLGAGCVIADSSNKQMSTLQELRKKSATIWLRLFLLGAIPWMVLGIIGLILSVVLGPGEPIILKEPDNVHNVFEGGLAIFALMFVWFLTMGYLLWFMVPLVSIAEVPLEIALMQALEALELNNFVVGLVVALSFSCLFGVISSVLIFPWVAIVASMMYVGYRHVWFGNPDITEKVKSPVLSSALSATEA